MTPYVCELLPQSDIDLFKQIRQVVQSLPDIDLGKDDVSEQVLLSCHILGRATAKVFGLKYIDGYFYPNYQHTWLLTSSQNIIDVYPVAMFGGPVLFNGRLDKDGHCSYSPTRWLYLPKSTRSISQRRFSKPWFRKSVEKIRKELEAIKARLK
jgi:hypothetical protein